MKSSSLLGLCLAASCAVYLGLGCSSNERAEDLPPSPGTGGSTAGSGGGSSGTGGTTADSGAGSDGGIAGTGGTDPDAGGSGGDASVQDGPSDANFNYDAPLHDGTITQDSACATAVEEAESLPLDIYLMLDRSGSMEPDCNVGDTTDSRWCRAINSIAGFVSDPSSVGMRVALEFFGDSNCVVADYANPAVPLAGGSAATIIFALNSASPSGLTPTSAALEGMVAFTAAHQTSGRAMIGILITDGNPTVCDTDTSHLATIAANHYAGTGIRTFVIGMDDALDFDVIETIAAAGGASPHDDYCHGTTPCHHYDVGAGDPQAFIEALQQIQAVAIGCQFQMPTTDAGVIDIEQVKIEYTPHGTGTPQELTRVNDAGGCVADGWYYDDNQAPTNITLCPAMCATVQADANAKILVLSGCLGS